MVSVQKLNDQKFLVSLKPNSSLIGVNRIIFISQDLVTIEKGSNYAEYKWEEFRSFTSFQVSKDRRDLLKLSFRSKGEDVEVGSFLNEDDKNVLIEELTQIIDTLNLDSFSNPEL